MKSAFEIATDVVDKRTSATETTELALERIAARDGAIAAFRETHDDAALARAAGIDMRAADHGDVGPLAGAPIAIKDNIASTVGRTSAGSRYLEEYTSPFDATAVRRLMDSGAVVVGRTNCDEFAMGSSSEHCALAAPRNPWDPERVPGGSSGGSAAAVAAGMCAAALGSDTGGSVRQPAAFCGVVGLKPTYGRVSRYGLVAFASSLDQIGPITTNVADAALMLEAMAGVDRLDATSADVPFERVDVEMPVEGLRIGVPREFRGGDNDPAVDAAIDHAIEVYRDLGATIVDVELPMSPYAIATYYVIAPAEASSNLARYDGIRYGKRAESSSLDELYGRSRAEGFGAEVRRRIMLGTYVLSAGYYDAYYKRAMQVRRLIKQDVERVFESCDVILGPTTPAPAFKAGAKADPVSMYLCDVYTTLANVAGHCAVSIPGGFADGLPIGLQLQAPAFGEATLLRAARMFEKATDFHKRRPFPDDVND